MAALERAVLSPQAGIQSSDLEQVLELLETDETAGIVCLVAQPVAGEPIEYILATF
jgi:hypothetical protein